MIELLKMILFQNSGHTNLRQNGFYFDTLRTVMINSEYRQVPNIRGTLVGNWIVDYSDVGAAPTTYSLST